MPPAGGPPPMPPGMPPPGGRPPPRPRYSPREIALVAAVVLLLAVLVGVLLSSRGGDDSTTETADASSTTNPATTTTQAATTTSTAAPSTTSSTTTSTTTTSTTTTTTTVAVAPLADLPSGEVAGFAIGSPMVAVVDELIARYGPPDTDSGWNGGCELDGGPDDTDRAYSWGRFVVRFSRWDGPEILEGWSWRPVDDDPTPGPITLHADLVGTATIGDAALATGREAEFLEDFFMTIVTDEFSWIYIALGDSETEPVFEVAWNPTFCE